MKDWHVINIHQRLLDLAQPRVMAVVNVTEDSFYTRCPSLDEEGVVNAVATCVQEGADIVDVGACSTRPGSQPVAEDIECERIAQAVRRIRQHYPHIPLSVDTFRTSVAEIALSEGADMINDVSGGNERMWGLVSCARVPYVLTYARASESKGGDIMADMIDYFARRLDILHRKGVADVLIDPGFGFGKTTDEDYTVLTRLHELECLHAPLLVGMSRKSMIYKPLNTDPQHALAGTIAAQTLALAGGANIVRVHDVKPAMDMITIYQKNTHYAHHY